MKLGSRAKFVLRCIGAIAIALLIASLFAAIVFLWGPAAWRYLKSLGKIDWAKITLWIWVFGYFIGAAQLWYQKMTNELQLEGSSLSQFLKMLILPAIMPIGFIHMLLQGLLTVVFFNFLHQQSKTIALRSFNVLLLIWISVYCILLFANLWQQDACHWVFPRILTCLLAKYDGLAGGLIGAGGTIFAAWIAWIAFQEQNKHGDSA